MRLGQKVREALSSARAQGDRLVLAEQLDRTVYGHVARAIENAGGVWTRKAQAFVFASGDAAAAIAPLLLTGKVDDARADHGAFYTPPALAQLVIARAAIRSDMEVLEPSAGGGALARPAAAAGGIVYCVDIRADACRALIAAGLSAQCADFLEETPQSLGVFDRVVMNPPFSRRQDVVHVVHALRFLRPGGRLVAIVSAGVLSREDSATVTLRAWIAGQGGAIESLPPGSFRAAGTEVRAALITVDLRVLAVPQGGRRLVAADTQPPEAR